MIDGIAKVLKKLLTLLPKFDTSVYVKDIQTTLKPYAGYINYFMPVGQMYDIFVVWAKCMTAYFVFITIKPFVMKIINKIIERGLKK